MRSTACFAVLVLAISAQAAFAQSANCPPESERPIVYIHKGDGPDMVVNAVRAENTMVLLDSDVDITFSMNNVHDPDNEGRLISESSPFIKLSRCVTLASYSLIISPPPASDGLAPKHLVPEPGGGRTPHSLGPRLRYLNDGRASEASFIEMDCGRNPNDPSAIGGGGRIKGIRIRGPNDDDHPKNERGIFINGCLEFEIDNNEIHGWGGAAIRVQDSELIKDMPDHPPDQEPSHILVKIHDNYIHHNQHSSSGGHSEGYGVDVQHGAFAEITQNVFDFNKHSITADGTSGGYHALRNLILKGGGFHNGEFLWIHWGFLRLIHVMDVHGTKQCPSRAGGAGDGALIGAIIGGLVGGLPGAVVGAIVGAISGALVGAVVEGLSVFNCGDAGFNFVIVGNTFQYSKTLDIKIRGKPKKGAEIRGNVFARSSKDDAVQDGEAQWYCFWACTSHNDNVVISGDNKFNDDTYGKYGVCDVDGDGIDDLVLMTGNTWWFSSAGKYPWSFLKADPAVLKDVQLGDFDADGRCDVMKGEEGSGPTGGTVDAPHKWLISSGARENFKLFVPSIAPLNEVRFGRFHPDDHNSNPRPPPTRAFRRNAEGVWFVTPISQPSGWTLVGSSGFQLADLRFGSFKIAGVTDVLSNVNFDREGPNRWATSHPAKDDAGVLKFGTWEILNKTLSDPVEKSNIFIANTKGGDTADDVLRFATDSTIDAPHFTLTVAPTWQRSKSGMDIWREWKSYVFEIPLRQGDRPNTLIPDEDGHQHADSVGPVGFVGQFSAPPGASTLTIDESRVGHFFWNPTGREGEGKGWLSDGVDNQKIGDDQLEHRLFHY